MCASFKKSDSHQKGYIYDSKTQRDTKPDQRESQRQGLAAMAGSPAARQKVFRSVYLPLFIRHRRKPSVREGFGRASERRREGWRRMKTTIKHCGTDYLRPYDNCNWLDLLSRVDKGEFNSDKTYHSSAESKKKQNLCNIATW